MKPFTNYKLTNAQCKRLCQLQNERKEHLHGVALEALVRKGLAIRVMGWKYPKTHRITTAGAMAFADARREGW